LENLLFAKIGVARRGGDIATFRTAWHSGRKSRRCLLACQLRLVRRLSGALICQDQKEHAQRRDEPGQITVKIKSHKYDDLLPCLSLTPLIFSAISINRLKMPVAS